MGTGACKLVANTPLGAWSWGPMHSGVAAPPLSLGPRAAFATSNPPP
jgi:hypothetical protein